MSQSHVSVVAVIATLAMVIGACSSTTPNSAPDREASSSEHGSMSMDSSMTMSDPDATPAFALDGADVVSGDFVPLGTGAPESQLGTVWVARHAEGTTVTMAWEGLATEVGYVAHLHVSSCADGGGAHYRHDPDGAPSPPNEIHLALTTDTSGSGSTTVTNPTRAREDAISVVIHEATDDAPKLACADLARGS